MYSINQPLLYAATKRELRDIPITKAKSKLAVMARRNAAHFLNPVLEAIKDDCIIYRYFDERQLLADIPCFDLLWLEWGSTGHLLNLIERKGNCKIWCRIHDWEIGNDEIMSGIDWQKADKLIFINPDSIKAFEAKVYSDNIAFIPNAVNERQFPFIERQFGKRILMASEYFQDRKNYPRAIRAFKHLSQVDSKWQLTIRAEHRGEYDQCLSQATGLNIVFEKPDIDKSRITAKDDILQAYYNSDIVLSTSNHEGFHYVIAEGMLTGCYPIVFNWEWGQAKKFWSIYVLDSEQDIPIALQRWEALTIKQKHKTSKQARQYVIDNFGLEASRKRILDLWQG